MSLGFTFNNKHSDEMGIIMQSADRTILPVKRKSKYEIPGKDGAYFDGNSNYEERNIRVQIHISGKERTIEALRQRIREIAKWLSADEALLIFDDEPDKAYTASIDTGLSLEQLRVWGQCELIFSCQPFAESVQYLTDTKDITENNDSLTVQVNGTQDTPCIITVKNTGTVNITGITIRRKAGKA